MDVRTSTRFRIVQVFLSRAGKGVYEVYRDIRNERLVCTCPGSRVRTCRHVEYVEERRHPIHGYVVKLDRPPRDCSVQDAVMDPERFRRWVLERGDVVVL